MSDGEIIGAAAFGPAQEDDVNGLPAWLAATLGGGGEPILERIGVGVGVANVLHRLEWDGRAMVMRRPPEAAAKLTASAGNMMREARVLGALVHSDVRCPHLVAMCDDPGVIGVPFLLMDYVDGFPPVDPLPQGFEAPAAKRPFGTELVDALSEVALVDWEACGL